MNNKLHIEVVSDHVCPWCYVGKKRLEKALAMRPDVSVAITWQPFQLSPDMPREGRLRSQHYAEIFGEDRAKQIMNSMKDTGKDDGIEFGYSDAAVSPNTLSAHALMLIAQEDEAIDASVVAEKLFAAHHVHCENIGEIDVLVRIAGEAGMDKSAIREALTSATEEPRVQSLIQHSVERGVTGVPFFIINGKYGLSGAQPADTLVSAFDQILEQDEA